eukprot:m.214746 g.214746  ORF g.214746 m.214746 type:complete len:998 (+) comp39819_c0_seq6:235-3228(+)
MEVYRFLDDLIEASDEVKVKELLSSQAKFKHIPFERGSTALHYAAGIKFQTEQEAREILGHLICEKKFDINVLNFDGSNPFFVACEYGNLLGMRWLTDQGSKVDCTSKWQGYTPMHAACRSLSETLMKVEYLLQAGLNFKTENGDGRTALHFAAENMSLSERDMNELIDLVLTDGFLVDEQENHYQKWSPLQLACLSGPSSAVKSLVNHSANVHIKDSDGSTPLLIACESKEDPYRKFTFLADQGANVEAMDKEGSTAMHYAAKSKFSSMKEADKMANFLIENYQSLASFNKNGESPLHFACKYSSLFGVKSLVSHGAEIECTDKNGFTPLLNCCQSPFDIEKKTEFLIEKGVSIEEKTKMNQNVLHILAPSRRASRSLLIFLVEKGADVFLKDCNGKRPHELAFGERRRVLLAEYTKRSELLGKSLLGEKVQLDSIKFSFIGDEMAGKTTLVHALLKMDVSIDPNDRTAGVDLYNALIPGVGGGSTWDFGAHPSFHGAHGLLFRASNTVFTLVLRIRVGQSIAPEVELLQKGRFWLGFVKAACVVERPSGRERQMKVVIVGNLIGAEEGQIKPSFQLKRVMEVLKEDFASTFDIAAVFEMDCSKQDSVCMQQYRAVLKKLRGQVIEMSSGVPKICQYVKEALQRQEKVLQLSMEQRPETNTMPFFTSAEYFSRWVKNTFDFSFDDVVVDLIAEYLDLTGVIIRLGNCICLHSFWLCRNVFGPLLAPPIFPVNVQAADDGQVKKEDVQSALKAFKNDLKHRGLQMIFDVTAQEAMEAFLHLELCYPVEGMPGGYLIPGLAWKSMPGHVWIKDDAMAVYRGLRYQCTHHETDIISPSVFVILHCRCSMLNDCRLEVWKDGFLVRMATKGKFAECLAKKRDDHSAIDIVVRSPVADKEVARGLLKEMKGKLENICDDRSQGTALNWWCFDSKQLEELQVDPTSYSLREVSAMAREGKVDGFLFSSSGKQQARVKDLIFQEDYAQSDPKVVERSSRETDK